jgi:hypothetical protein
VDDKPTKVCPECAETVKAAARRCRFCGHSFVESSGYGAPQPQSGGGCGCGGFVSLLIVGFIIYALLSGGDGSEEQTSKIDVDRVTCGDMLPKGETTDESDRAIAAVVDDVAPRIQTLGHSDEDVREAVASMLALKCGLARPGELAVTPDFEANVEQFLQLGQDGSP